MRLKNKIGLAILVPLLTFTAFQLFFVPRCCHDYMECDANMSKIWFGLCEYAEDHDGRFPAELGDIHPKYVDLRKAKCTMCRAESNSLETGYRYIPDQIKVTEGKDPVLFCKHYHLNGHGPDTYCAQFSILTNAGAIIHVRDYDLRKYDGHMRRYSYFRRFPHDGSKPTIELVHSLVPKFPDGGYGRYWIDSAPKKESQ